MSPPIEVEWDRENDSTDEVETGVLIGTSYDGALGYACWHVLVLRDSDGRAQRLLAGQIRRRKLAP